MQNTHAISSEKYCLQGIIFSQSGVKDELNKGYIALKHGRV